MQLILVETTVFIALVSLYLVCVESMLKLMIMLMVHGFWTIEHMLVSLLQLSLVETSLICCL